MMEKVFVTNTEQELISLGHVLSDCLSQPLVSFVYGHLGTGKTTLIRSILNHMGVEGPVQSPSFAIVESYPIQEQEILHIDLYRVSNVAELHELDLLDLDLSKSYVFIEWPEHGMEQFLKPDIEIHMRILDNDGRQVHLKSISEKGKSVLVCLNT